MLSKRAELDSINTDCSEDVPLSVSLLCVASHRGDGQDLHLPPLMSLECHQQRHGVIHPGVSVDNKLPPHNVFTGCGIRVSERSNGTVGERDVCNS